MAYLRLGALGGGGRGGGPPEDLLFDEPSEESVPRLRLPRRRLKLLQSQYIVHANIIKLYTYKWTEQEIHVHVMTHVEPPYLILSSVGEYFLASGSGK